MKRFLFLIVLFGMGEARAQGSWNILNARFNLNQQWSLFGEAQLRSLRYYDDFHYYELKAGAAFSISKALSLAAGLGIYDTYSPGGNFKSPMVNDEVRSWLQLSMTHYERRVKLEHRYRAEQRWTSDGYRNRFRYRLNSTLPLNKKKVEPRTVFLSAWNEIFFTNRAPYFERNRLFLGGGYEFSELFTLQFGYLHQFDYKINDETGRNFFQLSFLFDLDWQKKTGERVPGSMN